MIDDGRIGDCVIGGALGAGFVAFAEDFAALVEVVLDPGAGGEIGDEVELVPETVQFPLAVVVEDQLDQRGDRRGNSP